MNFKSKKIIIDNSNCLEKYLATVLPWLIPNVFGKSFRRHFSPVGLSFFFVSRIWQVP
jgi:hypothetical protein